MIINLFPIGGVAEPEPEFGGTWSYTVTNYGGGYAYLLSIRFDLDSSFVQSGVNCTITSVIHTSSGTEYISSGTTSSNESYSTFDILLSSSPSGMEFTCTVTHGADTDTETITTTPS